CVLCCAAFSAFAEENRWESSIKTFEERDGEAMPPEGAGLSGGISSIVLWNLEESFPDLNTINRGFGGSTIAEVNEFVDRIVTPYKPAKIVFYAGDNDIAKGTTAEQVLEDYKTFVEKVRPALPDAE